MKTGHIKQVVSSVRRKMGPNKCLSAAQSVRNSVNEYHVRIELDSHSDKIVLSHNCFIFIYTGKYVKVSPYSDKYELIQHVPVVTG